MLPEILAIIHKVAQVFDQLNVTYFIGGSVASGRYGLPRLTRDVDFVADLKEKHIDQSFITTPADRFQFRGYDYAKRKLPRHCALSTSHCDVISVLHTGKGTNLLCKWRGN